MNGPDGGWLRTSPGLGDRGDRRVATRPPVPPRPLPLLAWVGGNFGEIPDVPAATDVDADRTGFRPVQGHDKAISKKTRLTKFGVATAMAAAWLAGNAVNASPASAETNDICQVYRRSANWANDVAMGWYTWANVFGSDYAREQGNIYGDLVIENWNASGIAGCP